MNSLARLEDLVATWGTIPGAKIPVPDSLARELVDDIRLLLAQRGAGEFELFDLVKRNEARGDIRNEFARRAGII